MNLLAKGVALHNPASDSQPIRDCTPHSATINNYNNLPERPRNIISTSVDEATLNITTSEKGNFDNEYRTHSLEEPPTTKPVAAVVAFVRQRLGPSPLV